ncbi:MAG: CBS domain-containing protein [Chloroflexota bacterium]|nr:CBS domain-containing protein [Chloroflexota bacterium]
MNHTSLDTRNWLFPAALEGRAPDTVSLTVGGWMTAPVKSVHPNTAVPEAYNLMLLHGIRRLPVVDEGGLIGIVTLGDLREARPSSVVVPSLYELSYLLARATVTQVMTHHPFTVTVQTPLREAADLMRTHKIGSLPVVADENRLVGILTESDLFRMFMARWDATLAATPATGGTEGGV